MIGITRREERKENLRNTYKKVCETVFWYKQGNIIESRKGNIPSLDSIFLEVII